MLTAFKWKYYKCIVPDWCTEEGDQGFLTDYIFNEPMAVVVGGK